MISPAVHPGPSVVTRAGAARWRCLSLVLGLAACATVPGPQLALHSEGEPLDAWARVLDRYVDDQGRVDFAGLAGNRVDLDRYVAWVYETGPASAPALFPTPEHVLAYHLNAYNALALYKLIDVGVPKTLGGVRKISFFILRRVTVGGETLSLYAYEREIIRPLAEPRVHFALNCMSVGCPRLPREPFRAEDLEAQLERATRGFFGEARNVRVDHARRTLYFSEILDFYTEDFLHVAPSLPAYVNLYRSEKVPEDYAVEFTPYDWTVNAQ